jgi:2-dehydropantoate 2-reductase
VTRFVVYGAGAVGGLVGARLSAAGEEVLLIARGAHGEAIRRDGLAVDSAEGRTVHRLPVAGEPRAGLLGSGDVVLLGMKSQDTSEALSALLRAAPPSTPVVCLQNGVDNERAALRLFSEVYGVCVMCPSGHLEPGVVQAFSSPVPGLLDVGRYPSGTDELTSVLATAFRSAGFDSLERPDIMRWKYCKLLRNLGNAVGALLPPGDRPEIDRMAREEAVACLAAAGIDHASTDEDDARRGAIMKVRPLGEGPRPGSSSWQSLRRGAGSIESDYLNGEIVLLGRLHGISTPVNALLQSLADRAAVTGAAPESLSAADFERLLAGDAPARSG